jgi:uncharacterized protein YecE (DUF72 family)
VRPVPVPPELERVAERIPESVRLGTSSWSFPGWRGIVWADSGDDKLAPSTLSRDGLPAYSRHPLLRTVGIDRTFYAPVETTVLRRYAEAVPDHFRFVVKMPAAVTAPYALGKKPSDREPNPTWLDSAVAERVCVAPFVEGLGRHAGVLVAQLPPLGRFGREPSRFSDRLESFLRGLPRGPVYAVEPRDRRLLAREYRDALREAGATHCVSVHPRMPSVERQLDFVAEAGPLVVRWMLHPTQSYDGARERYAPFDRLLDEDEATRSALADAILGAIGRGIEVFIIANNKAEGSAPLTVFRLATTVAERLHVPPSSGSYGINASERSRP